MLSEMLETTLDQKNPVQFFLILLGQNPLQWFLNILCTALQRKNSIMQCCPKSSKQCKNKSSFWILLGQHCTVQNTMQCCLRSSMQHFIVKKPVKFCLYTLGTTLYRSKTYAILPKMLQTTLHKKILCYFVLILLRQHCTGQNSMQCCLRGSRQHCIRKRLVRFCLHTLGITLYR